MPSCPSRRTTWQLALALVCGFGVGVWAASIRDVPVAVVTEAIDEQPVTEIPRTRSVGGGIGLPTSTSETAETGEPVCEGVQPGPSWNCIDGKWQVGPPPAPEASGGGRIDRAAGCLTEQPGSAFVCDNGLWVLNGTAGTGMASASASNSARSDACRQPAPAADWTCENGAWTPPPPVAVDVQPPAAPTPVAGPALEPAPVSPVIPPAGQTPAAE